MEKKRVAKGQVTITALEEAYHISQSVGESVFPASFAGTIVSAITIVSTIQVTKGDTNFTDFTLGAISKPVGFSAITTDNIQKTITYFIANNTTTLADYGSLRIPVIINEETYYLAFQWTKAKGGNPGMDANLLDWVNDWNTNKTQINDATVITPRIFAGIKNTDQTLTGTAIGRFSLNVKNTSGSINRETVCGIYGFKEGYRTFLVDQSGNVQLGNDKQFIRYNASTGRVEFGTDVSLNWIGATYINKEGIFTGTLSAATVNAIEMNASRIVSGTLSTDRIDVNTLKSVLITAGNIEALTLDVTRGKIGCWKIDGDSIFQGAKNNTPGTYTGASGHVTLASEGIRGFKWRLDASGGGALAGGNISWDISGNLTFSPAVTLLWNTPINSMTTAMGGPGYPKLTKVTAEGIYTGTINATQITTGTIDADRIASGSIAASKLDAASIKSSIINTAYINGLACSFSQGTIGGFVITSERLYDTGKHLVIQSGNLRRIGICKAADANIAGGVSCIMLYYNTDFDWGLYGHDGVAEVFRLGSANRIAGWSINNSQIFKNNVSLGADGTIGNNDKWIFRNDGSGQIASGAISWDVAGKISFSSAVSLNWINAIDNIQIGGSNLLNNSSNWHDPGWNGGYASHGGGYELDSSVTFNGKPTLKTNAGLGLVYNSWIRLETNVEYTYSAMVMCEQDAIGYNWYPLHCWSGTDDQNQGKATVIKYDTSVIANEWKRIYITFKLTGDGNSIRPFFYRGVSMLAIFHIAYFKLEKGNKPTDWTQSVSDTNKLSLDAQGTANDIVTALGGGSYPKLTRIDSTGVYTGTLTAGQITSGTISAERIASGSITAAKLDAASIKSSLINTDYINGLSCEFTKGKVGGWTIEANALTSDHIALDNANKRIVVYGANSSVTIGHRVQLYYATDTNFGFFATDTTGNCVARLGSINQIAGWTLDTSRIYKNNVSLGADGTISNGTKWIFHNDGSGQLAGGAISWNASGSVTFSSSISSAWNNAANNGKLYVRGTGANHNANRVVVLNGNQIVSTSLRGLTLTVIARSDLALVYTINYNVYNSDIYCNSLATKLNSLGPEHIVILTSYDAISINQNLSSAIQHCGGSEITVDGLRYPYVLIGIPGIGKDNGLVSIHGYGSDEPYAEISTLIINGIPQGMNVAGKQKTFIDGYGIYTGNLNASQINAGTINADRIAAGSINASKLDAASIKSTIINTSYINGLACTFVRGTIGGWVIYSNSISKNGISLGSDGTISNSLYWSLNRDGSGKLAKGNIIWDAAGNTEFKGKLSSASGTIGGFEIGLNRIGTVNNPSNPSQSSSGMFLYNSMIGFNETGRQSIIGCWDNLGKEIQCRLMNTKASGSVSKYGLVIDIEGGSDPDSNIALNITGGTVGGLCPHPLILMNGITFSSAADLRKYNSVVWLWNGSNISFTLPQMRIQDHGFMFKIMRVGGGTMQNNINIYPKSGQPIYGDDDKYFTGVLNTLSSGNDCLLFQFLWGVRRTGYSDTGIWTVNKLPREW